MARVQTLISLQMGTPEPGHPVRLSTKVLLTDILFRLLTANTCTNKSLKFTQQLQIFLSRKIPRHSPAIKSSVMFPKLVCKHQSLWKVGKSLVRTQYLPKQTSLQKVKILRKYEQN